jgi:predicted NAD/FAD-binding protein
VNTTALVLVTQGKVQAIAALAVDGLTSAHSKRAYATAIADFMKRCGSEPQASFTKATVQKYKATLEFSGLSASSINVRMSLSVGWPLRPQIMGSSLLN